MCGLAELNLEMNHSSQRRSLRAVGTDPLLAQVDASQRHLQDILLVGMDVQPASLVPGVGSCCREPVLQLFLALLPPALHAQLHFHHWQVTQVRPRLR